MIALQDTSSSGDIECQDNIVISLPLTFDGFDLTPSLFIRGEIAGCSTLESLAVEPSTLFCFDAGDDVEYTIFNTNNGDTICTGEVRVQDAGETVVACADTAQIILPETGRDYTLSWRDVVTEFSDNCLSIIDLSISPRRVGCAEAGSYVPYTLAPRGESSTLCTGVLEVIDETPGTITCVDTIFTEIRPSGFPALVFPSLAFDEVTDNCNRITDFRIRPFFFFCPDSSATFTLTSNISGDTVCTGNVVVTGPPSIFGNCEDDDESSNRNSAENNLSQISYGNSTPREMLIYPNPVQQGAIQVQLPTPKDQVVLYSIFDMMGRQVSLQKADYFGGAMQVEVETLRAGTYFLQVGTEEGAVYTKRFVVNR
ncbi:MAG: T9SS type A sorting domain-containing protein [Bacteroidota bacterium]